MLDTEITTVLRTLAKGPLSFTSEDEAERTMPGILRACNAGLVRDPAGAGDPMANFEITARGRLALEGNFQPTALQLFRRSVRHWFKI